jgi:hypothetical protein
MRLVLVGRLGFAHRVAGRGAGRAAVRQRRDLTAVVELNLRDDTVVKRLLGAAGPKTPKK